MNFTYFMPSNFFVYQESMNFEYRAAEYFAEYMVKNGGEIFYDDLNCIREQAELSIVSFLNEIYPKSKNVLLLLFEKFPEIFELGKSKMRLSQQFLTLHQFSTPYSSAVQKKQSEYLIPCSFNLNSFEEDAVVFFKEMLSSLKEIHYKNVLEKLASVANKDLAKYFSSFEESSLLKFFERNSAHFLLTNGYVSLKNRCTPEANCYAHEKLCCGVSYILSCFKSIHYLELKQCLSYIFEDVHIYLNQFSLLNQRYIFECVPLTVMERKGLMTLVRFDENKSEIISSTEKLLLLIVCLLAFYERVHFQLIVEDVRDRAPECVSSILCNLSVSDQFKFLKGYEKYFEVNGSGYMKLWSFFVFPEFNFEQEDSISGKVETPPTVSTKEPSSNGTRKGVKKNPSLKVTNAKNDGMKQLCAIVCCSNTEEKVQNFELLEKFKVYVGKKINDCILYLSQYFVLSLDLSLVQTVLHVVNVPIMFKDLFTSSLCDVIKESFLCFHVDESKRLILPNSNTSQLALALSLEEKDLAFITYMLTQSKQMHYREIFKKYEECNSNTTSTGFPDSDKFRYFKNQVKYFIIGGSGYVTLNVSSDLKRIISSILYSINMTGKKLVNHLKPSANSVAPSKLEASKLFAVNGVQLQHTSDISDKNPNSGMSVKGKYVHKSASVVNNAKNTTVKDNNSECLLLCKKIQTCILFLSKYFRVLLNPLVLRAILHIQDSRNYFCNVSAKDKNDLIKKSCLLSMSKENYTSLNSNSDQLLDEEQNLLFIIYMLILEKKMHFVKIFKNFTEHSRVVPNSVYTSTDKFKYFTAREKFFLIDDIGFVVLNEFQEANFLYSCKFSKSINEFNAEVSPLLNEWRVKNMESLNLQRENKKDFGEASTSYENSFASLPTPVLSPFQNNVAATDSVTVKSDKNAHKVEKIMQILSCKKSAHKLNGLLLENSCNGINSSIKVHEDCKFSESMSEKYVLEFTSNPSVISDQGSEGSICTLTAEQVYTCQEGYGVVNDVSAQCSNNVFSPEEKDNYSVSGIISQKIVEGLSIDSNKAYEGNINKRTAEHINKCESIPRILLCEKCTDECLCRSGKKDEHCYDNTNIDLKQNSSKLLLSSASDQANNENVCIGLANPYRPENHYHSDENLHSETTSSQKSDPDCNVTESKNHLLSFETTEQHLCSPPAQTEIPVQNGSYRLELVGLGDNNYADKFDNLTNSILKGNVSLKSYGEELVESYLDNLRLRTCTEKQQNELKDSNCKQTDTSAAEKCYKNIVAECRAINFFTVVLGSYDIGVPVKLLQRHLNLASKEVLDYIFPRYQKDFLSFFLKHKNFFYVSPYSRHVYLKTKKI